jgi:hypothetical protein
MRDMIHRFFLGLYRFYHFNIYLDYQWIRGVTFLRRKLAFIAAKTGGAKFYSEGEDILEKDWDNLVILDAGRADVLEEITREELSSIVSKNSSSCEWLQANFQGEYEDIVMVTGNPYIHKFREEDPDEIFCEVYDAWEYNYDNSFLEPEAVNAAVKDALRDHPEKRMVIHYMQPHFPVHNEDETTNGIWNKSRKGEISDQRLIEIYGENYLYVLKNGVREIQDKLQGKTIVSADHGQLLGEYGLYKHPSNFNVEELVKVPWVQSDKVLENLPE